MEPAGYAAPGVAGNDANASGAATVSGDSALRRRWTSPRDAARPVLGWAARRKPQP